MRKHTTLLQFAVTWTLCLGAVALAQAAPFDQAHPLLDKTLKTYVKDALVDYPAVKANRQDLDRYLGEVAAVAEPDFKQWTEKQRLAYLINAYNGYTLQLIIDHYPLKSIKDIGGWLKGPWDQPVVHLFGRTLTLNDLEHKILRVEYAEPRIHFALVCAARGCPPLRGEAYVADRLEAQLDDQARQFLATANKNRVDAGEHVVYLSPLFKWYGADFEKKSGSVLAALKSYWPKEAATALANDGFKTRYTEYDWSLNQSSK